MDSENVGVTDPDSDEVTFIDKVAQLKTSLLSLLQKGDHKAIKDAINQECESLQDFVYEYKSHTSYMAKKVVDMESQLLECEEKCKSLENTLAEKCAELVELQQHNERSVQMKYEYEAFDDQFDKHNAGEIGKFKANISLARMEDEMQKEIASQSSPSIKKKRRLFRKRESVSPVREPFPKETTAS